MAAAATMASAPVAVEAAKTEKPKAKEVVFWTLACQTPLVASSTFEAVGSWLSGQPMNSNGFTEYTEETPRLQAVMTTTSAGGVLASCCDVSSALHGLLSLGPSTGGPQRRDHTLGC